MIKSKKKAGVRKLTSNPTFVVKKKFKDRNSFVDAVADAIAPEVQRVATLGELEAEVNRELDVAVRLANGRKLAIGVRRLTPAESVRLEEMMQEIVPPVKQVPVEGGGMREEFDLADAGHQKKVRERGRECRALACWWGCGLFREEWERKRSDGTIPTETVGGTPALPRIVEFVEGRLTEQILEQIYYVARSMDLEVMGRVNF